VQLEPEKVTYTVNPSNAKTKTTLLQELRTVLSAGSTREPRALAIAWLELRERHDRERNELIRKEADRVALERAAAQARHEAALAERRERLNAALKALGAGLGALVVLGLSLAILSIERNTRALLYRDPSGARVS
jgi:type VI protein secretion system component VasF